MRRIARAFAAPSLLLLLSIACGSTDVRARDPAQAAQSRGPRGPLAEAQWQDALGARPALLVSLRPKALREDRIYGPLLRFALRVARRRSRVVAGTRVLEAVEDAEQFIATVETGDALGSAASEDGPERGTTGGSVSGDIVAVVRGVRSDVDPEALVDSDGHALWSPGPTGHVRELVHERDEDGTPNPASLFELPGRTWVIATGTARARARDAFAHPSGRAEVPLDPDALAVLRIDGPSLVAHVPVLRGKGALGAVGNRLDAVVLELAPGVEHQVRALVSYADAASAKLAEEALREVQDAVTREKTPGLAWLASATVARDASGGASATSVHVTAPIPQEVTDAWLGGATAAPARPAPADAGPPL